MSPNRVGWDDDPLVSAWPGLPPLDADCGADACVVGLGISGLTAVATLLDRGLTVVGVDAGRIAAGAAGRNGGFLLAGPAPFLHDALARWGPSALDLYRATLAEIDRVDGARRTGSIRLADDADELADCRRHADVLRRHAFAVEDYDGPLGRGIFLPDDAAVNPAVRAVGMATTLSRRARLFEHSPARLDGRLVVTPGGTVGADVVVLAVDGGLDLLVPSLADRVRTARLQMLATSPLPSVLPCPVYTRWGYDYAQQAPDGRLYVGGGRDRFADAEWTHEVEPTAEMQRVIEQVASRLAGRTVAVTHRWAASVGYTGDGRPLVTEVAPGVVACGGYSGTGNLVGPVAARAAVALALDGTPPPAWAACTRNPRPARELARRQRRQ